MADLNYFEPSDNIIVFPASNRKADDDLNMTESNKLTEYRFSRFIMSLLKNRGVEGFVLSNNLDEITSDDSLAFILAGHSFEIHNLTNLLNYYTDSNKIYAQLSLRTISYSRKQDNDSDLDYAVLDGFNLSDLIDDNQKFQGIRFSDEKLSAKGNIKELLLLEKIDGQWYIPGESKILFVPGYDKSDISYEDALLAAGENGLYWDKALEDIE